MLGGSWLFRLKAAVCCTKSARQASETLPAPFRDALCKIVASNSKPSFESRRA